MSRSQGRTISAGLLVLSVALFFLGLGTPGLFDADEPAYAQAAREMRDRGDWVTPTFNGAPRFDKPVLFYWLLMGSYALFGVGEFAVRVWSALAGAALVLLTAWAARRWWGPPADRWAGLALATCFLTALLARAAVTDMLLVLGITTAILAGVAALDAPAGEGRAWARLLWGAMAWAVLVKGPIGVVIPGMTFGLALLATRELRSGLRRLVPWEGPLLFLALVLPWYALVLEANGWAFIEGFIVKHHLTRYAGVVSSHAGPFWFYLPVILVGFFPWSGYLPLAGWRAWQILRRRQAARAEDRLVVVCVCWAVGVLVFFSLAGTKLPSYLFPIFPALALLVGGLGMTNEKLKMKNRSMGPSVDRFSIFHRSFSIDRARVDARLTRLAPWLIGAVGFPLATGFALVPWIFEWARPAARGVLDGVAAPTALAVVLAAILGVGTLLSLAAGPRLRPAILAAMMAGTILVAGTVAAPRAYAILQGALREFSDDARRLVPPGGTVVAYGLNAPTIVFYAERRVLPLGSGAPDSLERIQRLLAEGRPLVVITRSVEAPTLDRVPGLVREKARGGYALYRSDRHRLAPPPAATP